MTSDEAFKKIQELLPKTTERGFNAIAERRGDTLSQQTIKTTFCSKWIHGKDTKMVFNGNTRN